MSEVEHTDVPESGRTDAHTNRSGEGSPRERLTPPLSPLSPRSPRSPREQPARRSVNDQLLDTGQFVECIFSCQACGLSGTSIARPHMLIGKTCAACGELVSVTTI
jgi:hypothetical protein